MDIYAIFNSDTGVYQAALIQGSEQDGGSFDNFGDERWIQASENIKNIMRNSSDWIQISEEDFEKYKLGTHSGDNDTGYLYDFSTGTPISAPPRPFDTQIANIQSKYSAQYKELKNDYLDALIIDADTSTIKDRYNELVENSNNEFIAVIQNNS